MTVLSLVLAMLPLAVIAASRDIFAGRCRYGVAVGLVAWVGSSIGLLMVVYPSTIAGWLT